MCPRRILASVVLVLAFGLAAGAGAQEQDPTAVPRPSPFSAPPAIGKIVVHVRDVGGAQISIPASLRLYSDVLNVQITRNVQDSSRVIFENIPLGEYHIEVRASGYVTAIEEAAIVTPNAIAIVFVNLHMETGPSAANNGSPGPPLMTPKALKALNQALAAFRKNDLKQAQEHLDRARKLAPNHPDVYFMQGLIYMQQENSAAARASLEAAVNFYPRHADAQAALGTVLYRLGDYAAAITALEKAVEISPQVWQSHRTLALCHIRQHNYEKARAHAERAIETAGEKAPELHLLLARVLILLNQKDKARAELQAFITGNPGHPGLSEAQKLMEFVPATLDATPDGKAETHSSPSADRAMIPEAALSVVRVGAMLPETRNGPGRWAPPSVDDTPPVLMNGASCNLPEVLAGTGKQAMALAANLEQVTATERIEQADLDEDGNQRDVQTNVFDYLVSIGEPRKGHLAVEENRVPLSRSAAAPRYLTNGLGALALIFHPYYAKDFEMHCEGLTEWKRQPAWSVYFKQRSDRPSRIRSYEVREGRFDIPLKGRAWIAANNFQVLRLETDLVEPVKRLRLEQEHLVIEYQPVDFKTRKVRLWLPVSAELYAHLRGHRFLHHHSFADYLVFSVDVTHRTLENKKP